jgi:HSP20 family molecular chaperone IbpA
VLVSVGIDAVGSLKMDDIQSIHWRHLHGRLGDVVYQLTKVQFTSFGSPEKWRPAVNAYRCAECIAVCLDLAGVDRKRIEIRVEPRRLLIRGYRQAPEPDRSENKPVQVLLMEIDYGPFERELLLPMEVDPKGINAEQHQGLLWVYLRLRGHS